MAQVISVEACEKRCIPAVCDGLVQSADQAHPAGGDESNPPLTFCPGAGDGCCGLVVAALCVVDEARCPIAVRLRDQGLEGRIQPGRDATNGYGEMDAGQGGSGGRLERRWCQSSSMERTRLERATLRSSSS